jgi:hypothetical protein
MWPRLSIVLGLVAGVAAGALILGALLFLTPDPGSSATPTPSPSPVPSASPSPTASPSATASPSPSATAAPSASASASPASSSAALSRLGEPAPALVAPKVGVGTVDLAALGGIGPDMTARGLTTILPGVEVTP